MAIRCPDCNKFASLDTQEPEVEGLEIEDNADGHATVMATVRMVRACADCGTELKETSFDVEAEVTGIPEAHAGLNRPEDGDDGHELEVEDVSIEATATGGGRYAKNMIGFALEFKVTCPKCEGFEVTGQVEDSLQASAWDEMV